MGRKRIEKAQIVLFSLIDLYLEEGKPIGSKTLKEKSASSMSSATIRNYFASLEEEGYLQQHHASGGRTPTLKALREYAYATFRETDIEESMAARLSSQLDTETKEVALHLQHAADLLSELAGCAVVLSFPRFDQDLVRDVKFVAIDETRCLSIIVTQFGIVDTELIQTPRRLTAFAAKRIEAYFRSRMTGVGENDLDPEEREIADHLYKEVVLRHIVSYTNFSSADIYKTGFSTLLRYPECQDAETLSHALSIFENDDAARSFLTDAMRRDDVSMWIGEGASESCSLLAIPYSIHGKKVGAIALLGPTRIPYPTLFALLRQLASLLGRSLSRSIETFHITYRAPQREQVDFYANNPSYGVPLLLEGKDV